MARPQGARLERLEQHYLPDFDWAGVRRLAVRDGLDPDEIVAEGRRILQEIGPPYSADQLAAFLGVSSAYLDATATDVLRGDQHVSEVR